MRIYSVAQYEPRSYNRATPLDYQRILSGANIRRAIGLVI